MVKKLLPLVVVGAVGAVAKYLLDKAAKSSNEADLWAEATDSVPPAR